MAAIIVKQFGGVSPRTPPRYLQDTQAQNALNCPAWLGSLKGLPGTTFARNTDKTNVKSLYLYESNYWLEFTADTDVVRGPVAGDTEARIYWTNGGVPQKANNTTVLTGGTSYPVASYNLGVPRPATACVATVSGSGTGLPETRVYTDTFVTAWGEESQPADASNEVSVQVGQTVTLSSFAPVPAGSHNIATRRIYRLVTGSTGEYLFVDEIPAAQATYADTKLAADLGEVIPSISWAAPPSGLKGLVPMANGVLAAFKDRDVYFCDPYHPFAWPAEYINTVDYPVVGLGVMDTTLAVLTTGVPYFLQGTHPEAMAMVKSDIQQACVSKQSIVSMGGAVFYASPDGLVKLSPGGSGLITEAMFTKTQWQTIKPESLRAFQWDGRYVAFYDTGAVKGGFVFDPASGAFVWHDIYASAAYSDLLTDQLYLVINNQLHTWYSGAEKSYTWRSKKFSLPKPMCFANAQVEAEGYPVTAKFYGDGTLIHTQTVSSRAAFRLPALRYRDLEFEITGIPEVFSVVLTQTSEELARG